VEFEITPEASAEERAAIVAAFVQTLSDGDPVDPWWEAGVREAVDYDGEEFDS
jgi:hypothetical protein